MTFSNNTPVDVRDAYVFLAEYAAWLLGCGATCIRITKNVTRIAKAWNLKVEVTIMPGSVHLSVFDNDTKQSFFYLKRKPKTAGSWPARTGKQMSAVFLPAATSRKSMILWIL